MAYSDNIRKIAIALNSQGHSAEDISKLFSEIHTKEGFRVLSEIARQFSFIFTEADWQEILSSIPSAKTIREWLRKTEHIPETNKMQVSSEIVVDKQMNSDCSASPKNMDVVKLKELKIPKNEAPEILREWRSFHRNGKHEYCELFTKLIEDIQVRKIPFGNAKGMLLLGIKAVHFDMKRAKQDIESARVYHPWESLESHKSFMKETDEIRKPGPSRIKHLEEIKQMLYRFQLEIDTAIEYEQCDRKFYIEQNNNIDKFISHCPEIEIDYNSLLTLRIYAENNKQKDLSKKFVKVFKCISRSITQCINDQIYLKRFCLTCVQLDEG
jgi:hypothetical protein